MYYNKPNNGGMVYSILGLTKKSYLLKISEGIHDEGVMKS